MTPNPPEILRDRGQSLEDEFFRREDQRLMERLSELKAVEATREALGKASGITKPAVLETLMELGIRAETIAALSIVPLVEVAWADGALDAKERRAIVERAAVNRDSTAGALLEAWLDAARLKTGLLERARAVATATGGLFGVGSRISASESGDAGQARSRISLQPVIRGGGRACPSSKPRPAARSDARVMEITILAATGCEPTSWRAVQGGARERYDRRAPKAKRRHS
jgi:hypothetical protein